MKTTRALGVWISSYNHSQKKFLKNRNGIAEVWKGYLLLNDQCFMYRRHTWGEMKKRISAEKMKFQKFIMLLRAVHLLWKTIPLVKIEFNWKTSMGSFLGKEGGGEVKHVNQEW